jgi:hypothetical protein
MALTLTPEQIEAWTRISPETVIGNTACDVWAQERTAKHREALEDVMNGN